MGINLSIVNDAVKPRDHPEWDWYRHSGDREVANYIGSLPDTIKHPGGFYYRPSDNRLSDHTFGPELFQVAGYRNADRWLILIRILRDNPDYWMSNE